MFQASLQRRRQRRLDPQRSEVKTNVAKKLNMGQSVVAKDPGRPPEELFTPEGRAAINIERFSQERYEDDPEDKNYEQVFDDQANGRVPSPTRDLVPIAERQMTEEVHTSAPDPVIAVYDPANISRYEKIIKEQMAEMKLMREEWQTQLVNQDRRLAKVENDNVELNEFNKDLVEENIYHYKNGIC